MRGVISNVWTGTTGSFASRLAQLVRARRGPVLWLTLCGTLLVIAIFVGTIMMVNEFRKRAIRNSERELQNTVTLLTRHFDQQLLQLFRRLEFIWDHLPPRVEDPHVAEIFVGDVAINVQRNGYAIRSG